MTITLQAVNELIQSLESAGELSIKERKYLELAKAYQQLAAENVGLKKFIQTDCFVGHIEPETFHEEEVTRYVSADGYEPETPATDRIVAGIKADGVEMFVEKCREKAKQAVSSDIRDNWWLAGEHADDFAKQLREGAK
ncbi:hypothetical protein [Raoultella ornithinolytica]|uniref:hypothetical protein n=1 Tax=Raoultella ornithinolytica TaxID=54291 RepID=UPI000CF34380|nr:hypothetical protein [Raoultella ornithinolytica]PQH29108.1 hypothetical protein CWD63_00215 [Raoultella ornithinolytica]